MRQDTGNDSSTWRTSASIERWRNELLHLTGCAPGEITEKVELLLQYCIAQQISPERLVNECRYSPDRIVQRTFYLNATHGAKVNLVVQSFLIHNGINVFGELVCMPDTLKSLVEEQGDQWTLQPHKNSTETGDI